MLKSQTDRNPKKLFRVIVAITCLGLLQACDIKYSGNIDAEGYYMYRCGSDDPLGGVTLTFERGGRSLLSDKTDAFGHFHVIGDYEFKSRKEFLPGDISIVGNGSNGWYGSIELMEMVEGNIPKDTIYRHHSTRVVLQLKINESVFDEQDTLFLRVDNDTLPEYYKGVKPWQVIYNLKYAGPFQDGQILDTVISRVSPHVGYSKVPQRISYFMNDFQSYGGWSNSELPFNHGQRNIKCGCFTPVNIELY